MRILICEQQGRVLIGSRIENNRINCQSPSGFATKSLSHLIITFVTFVCCADSVFPSPAKTELRLRRTDIFAEISVTLVAP